MANASQLEPAHTLPTAAIEEYHSIWFEHPTSGWTRVSERGHRFVSTVTQVRNQWFWLPVSSFYLTAREALFAPFKGVGSISETGPGLFRVIHLCITAYFTQLSIYITFLPKSLYGCFNRVRTCVRENQVSAVVSAFTIWRKMHPGSLVAVSHGEAVNNFTMVGNGKASNSFGPDLLQSFLTNDSLSFYRYHWIAYRKELMQKPKGKTSVRGVGSSVYKMQVVDQISTYIYSAPLLHKNIPTK
ncbi:hypothetical protein B0H14DRAFT_2651613 [Mycena olivaceomarginata]|nr:hypothetical protein B0H14DRAFT_2651613 [Mycena olivaceomarginata]